MIKQQILVCFQLYKIAKNFNLSEGILFPGTLGKENFCIASQIDFSMKRRVIPDE